MSLSPKRSKQLQDLSRVLLGLAIALQHTASHEAKLLTHHAHVFHHSNKHVVHSAQHYADAAINAAKGMAATITPPASTISSAIQTPSSSTASSPYPTPPSSAQSSSAFTAASSLSSVLPSGMDVLTSVSKVMGAVQSLSNTTRPTPNSTASTTPSPYPVTPSSFTAPLSAVLPSGSDIAEGVARAIGAVQSAAGGGRTSTTARKSTAPYPASSMASTAAGSLSSVLPSGADIASNVARVIGAVQSPLSAVSSLSNASTAFASNALPLLSSLPLPQLAAALISSALPPGVPRPSAEQVNSAVNALSSIAQQLAQQLSQQAATATQSANAQQPVSAGNLSPYPATASSAAESSATIPPPSFVDIGGTAAAPSTSMTAPSSAAPSTAPVKRVSPSSTLPRSPSPSYVSPSISSSSPTDSRLASPATPNTLPPRAPATPSTPPLDLPPPAFLNPPKSSSSTTPPPPPPLTRTSTVSATADDTSPLFDLPSPAFLSQPTPTESTTTPSRPPLSPPLPIAVPTAPPRAFEPRSRTVPSSPIGRVLGFGGIAMRMLTGTVVDATKRIWGGDDTANIASTLTPTASHSLSTDATNPSTGSVSGPSAVSRFLSPANTERLAEGLCRMRGAALKIGQMLSIQDDALLPPPLAAVLARVRDSADMMPQHQLRSVLSTEWGDGWETRLDRFDDQPIAAASIGQVHRGSVRGVGEVVVKVQYPGVADSIESDVENVRRLISWFNIAPKGLYLDKTMDAAKEELSAECDYRLEAANQVKFRQLLRASPLHPRVSVPAVVEQLCTRQVLVSEWVEGVPIDRLESLPQAERNQLCRDLVQLCLLELFVWRFMQTDPNWSNFLYDTHSRSGSGGTLNLVDFGACIAYRKPFIDDYLRMVYACAEQDRPAVIEYSRRLGFITGEESREMLNAHVAAALIIGEPFSSRYGSTGGTGYDFAAMNMSGRVSELARVMVRLRLTAPPKESYTLHRKLSGCFLTCKKLNAQLSLRDMFMDVYSQYQF